MPVIPRRNRLLFRHGPKSGSLRSYPSFQFKQPIVLEVFAIGPCATLPDHFGMYVAISNIDFAEQAIISILALGYSAFWALSADEEGAFWLYPRTGSAMVMR